MRLSEEEINSVRNQADIVDIVSQYLPVVKKGKSFGAVCPFHDDHDPSLSLSQDKQIYKCFVCGAGGNVFTFVQNYEKCSFPEAVVKVAEKVGIKLDYQPEQFASPKDPYKEEGYKVLNEAIRYMTYGLNSSGATDEKNYLLQRGITANLIEMFEIGYNESNNRLYQFLKAKGYEDKVMISTNLVRVNESGLYDTFAERITFPIHDEYGNPIGFTARTLNPDISSKYINTAETDFYVKGNVVYNLHRAKPYAKKENQVILVEGVTDVLAFAKAGMFNVCATLGTAGTAEQLKKIRSCSTSLMFCYDGDAAGQAATYRVGKLAKTLGFEVLVASNKTNEDPDEIVEKHGAAALQKMISIPQVWMEFVFDYFQSKSDMSNYSEKKEFAQRVMDEINLLHDDFDRQNFIHRLSQITGFNNLTAISVEEKEKKQGVGRQSKRVQIPSPTDGREVAEKIVLSQMLLDQKAVELFKNELGFMTKKNHHQLALMILNGYQQSDEVVVAELIDLASAEEREILMQVSTEEEFSQQYSEEIVRGAIERIKKSLVEEKVARLKKQISEISNEESQEILLQEYIESLNELRRYNDEKGK
ncbi:MAG: DNA primase [Anaerorhabdus sp.]